jgi:hypothetical protein
MEPNTYTVDQIRQLYSTLPFRVNERLKKGDKIHTDDNWKPELERILNERKITFICKTIDVAGLNVHEITVF